jgi:hypothetical protein
MTRSQTFYAAVVTVVGIIVFFTAASCAASFAGNGVFGQPLVCGGWYDHSARVATFSLYIATGTAKGTHSSARCSYATVTVTHVFASSLTAHLSNDGQFDCTKSVCQATTGTPGKGTRGDYM